MCVRDSSMAKPLAYSHGRYYGMGEELGSFGYSVRKAEKKKILIGKTAGKQAGRKAPETGKKTAEKEQPRRKAGNKAGGKTPETGKRPRPKGKTSEIQDGRPDQEPENRADSKDLVIGS